MTDETVDVRRKRLQFRAWHRGIKEMDLIMGRFADAHIQELDTPDLDLFEALLEEPDDQVYGWIANREPVPDAFNTPIFKRICQLDFMGTAVPKRPE
ncbi:MAG: succinate dehydrogenase assembly factor 2 [Parvibaculaceae bacterium]|nr:succinate dehydrogenase assembly factor 2 [Parvibaculaceae bacterium]HBM86970.1 succinate dehydrogenase assembly factor 2 [Rhodobiaceae bacterium]